MRMIQVCWAGMSGFPVVPGILLGGGGIHNTGPPSRIAGHSYSLDSSTRRVIYVLDAALCVALGNSNEQVERNRGPQLEESPAAGRRTIKTTAEYGW